MTHDALLSLQDSVTKTASFSSVALNIPMGEGQLADTIYAEIFYSAASNASGSNGVQFDIEHSDDNATFYLHASGAADILALSTTAQAGKVYIPVATNKPYIRLKLTISGAGSTPTVTYNAYLGSNRP